MEEKRLSVLWFEVIFFGIILPIAIGSVIGIALLLPLLLTLFNEDLTYLWYYLGVIPFNLLGISLLHSLDRLSKDAVRRINEIKKS